MKETPHQYPPKWPLTMLRIFIKKDYLEEVEGDMEEVFQDNLELYPIKKAKRKYLWDVLKLLRPVLTRKLDGTQKLNYYGMIKNSLKIALRNLIKQKEYSAINVLGLTVSMAISMIIILFLIDQDRMDEHNPLADRIYRITTEYDDEAKGRIVSSASTPYELGQLIEFNLDQTDEISQLMRSGGNVKFGDNVFNYNGLFVSPNFLSFFDFELLDGDNDALSNINSVVLSKELAEKLFSEEDPIGQIVTIDGDGTFSVTGIIDKDSRKSHLDFDLLLSSQIYLDNPANKIFLTSWEVGYKHFYNYVRLEEGIASSTLSNYLATIDSKFSEETADLYRFDLQRLDKINLGRLVRNELSTTTPDFVMYFFIVLGTVLMLSASFNYMNLSIARGLKRAKEVGVRKVIGAGKRQIVFQFLIEAQLIMFCSLVVAYLLLQLLVPIFNELKILRDINGAITMNFNTNLEVYLVFIAFSVIVGLLAGLYPALYLSSFKSLKVLKGTGNAGKSPSFVLRKILVFFQYAFSVIFIITTIILYQQAQIYANVNYGFSHQNVINVPMSRDVPYETFRSELLQRSEIAGVSAVSNLPIISFFEDILVVNKINSEVEIRSSLLSVDPYAIENLNLELIAGRNYMPNVKSDEIDMLIINEKALDAYGFISPEEALDQTIEVIHESDTSRMTAKGRIIGVVKDFNYKYVFLESGPLVMNYNPEKLRSINIKTRNVDEARAVEVIEDVWKSFDTIHPLEYETYEYSIADIDDEFEELVQMIGLVSFIAIVIACLGQFSMVVHHVQLKVKEIGIRKVLGSNLSSLMLLLSKDFLIVIFLAVLVATPLAWKINDLWTSKVYSAPELSVFNISLGVIIILAAAFLTIFVMVRKAVNANPVESLKYE